MTAAPFGFPERYGHARRLARAGFRTFPSTSAGRLFDSAAALLGFTKEVEYEGQAAVWLEQLAWGAPNGPPLPFQISDHRVDFRPALHAMAHRRREGRDEPSLARAFHDAVASGIVRMSVSLCQAHAVDTVVLSGGTFQNALLIELVRTKLPKSLHMWTNRQVPPSDGGISLGQAAIAAVAQRWP